MHALVQRPSAGSVVLTEDILNRFDIDVCRVAFRIDRQNGRRQFMVDDSTAKAISTKHATVVNANHRTFERIGKYQRRGYMFDMERTTAILATVPPSKMKLKMASLTMPQVKDVVMDVILLFHKSPELANPWGYSIFDKFEELGIPPTKVNSVLDQLREEGLICLGNKGNFKPTEKGRGSVNVEVRASKHPGEFAI